MRPELKISASHRTNQKNFWFQKTILHFFSLVSRQLITFGLLEKLCYEKTPVSQQF
jgi:hypothetical protein